MESIGTIFEQKTGKKLSEADYRKIPTKGERYNFKFVRGSLSLIMGNVMTKKESDKLINWFLTTKITKNKK